MSYNRDTLSKPLANVQGLVSGSVPSLQTYNHRPLRKYEAIVLENKVQGDGNMIRVLLSEMLPLETGHLRNNPIPMKRVYTDARGRVKQAVGTHNNNITAQWYNTNGFRKSPPDVQRDERVLVWQLHDSDTWYWEECNRDTMTHRRLETVVHSINADKQVGGTNEHHDENNTYYQEFSSHNKSVTIATSKMNGEFTTYMIQINAGEGAMFLKDGVGDGDTADNFIEINSKEKKVWLRNVFKVGLELNKNDINTYCVDDHNEKVGRNKVIQIGNDETVTIVGNRSLKIGGNQQHEITGDMTITVNGKGEVTISGDCVIKAASVKIDTPETTVTGNVNIDGALNVKGSTSLGGGGSVTGNMAISGNLSAQGPVDFPSGGNINGYD